MEFVGLVSTVVGALIALVATAGVERRRWQRESEQRTRDELRAAYIGFLSATAAASETLVNVARGHDRDDSASARVGNVLRDNHVLTRRLELTLIADDTVVEEAGRMVTRLRAYREVVERGVPFDTEEFQRARTAVHDQRDLLTRLMRDSL
ncbi:hypothetical protein [Streptomyces sp. NPDC002328]|uniref:hypothetical protein n=1 Tax=Streptomyces sp. NPDC002328 TaxID=3364642 RepID=UPI00368FDA9D